MAAKTGFGISWVFHCAILSAALDPDVACAQAVAQLGEEAELVALRIDGAVAEHGGAPAGPHEAARRIFGKASAVAGVEPLQRLGCVEQRRHGGDAAERESGEKRRPDPSQQRMAVRGDRRIVRALGPDQAARLSENVRQAIPRDDGVDSLGHVAARGARLQQRVADIGQQAQGVVDGAGVLLHPSGGPTLGAPEEASDQPVEQADDLVGQALRGVENRDDKRRPATQRRQRPKMLSGQSSSLLSQPPDAFFVDPGQHGRIDAERPRRFEPCDQISQRLGLGRAGHVAHPGQRADSAVGRNIEQGVQRL